MRVLTHLPEKDASACIQRFGRGRSKRHLHGPGHLLEHHLHYAVVVEQRDDGTKVDDHLDRLERIDDVRFLKSLANENNQHTEKAKTGSMPQIFGGAARNPYTNSEPLLVKSRKVTVRLDT